MSGSGRRTLFGQPAGGASFSRRPVSIPVRMKAFGLRLCLPRRSPGTGRAAVLRGVAGPAPRNHRIEADGRLVPPATCRRQTSVLRDDSRRNDSWGCHADARLPAR
jgi:hypothetical protein